MKIVRLLGGLGNQMFQYAFGKVIEAEAYDVSWFDEVKNSSQMTQRSYELDFFKCQVPILSDKELSKYKKNNKILKKIGIKTKLPMVCERPENIYNPNLLKIKRGIFEGYFQCAQYYDKIRPQLLLDFVPANVMNNKNQEILNLIKNTNSVSLHVRRGDYLKIQHIVNICNTEYYQKAINFIAEKIQKPHFFLFSDDILWVQENLKIKFPYTIVDINHGKDSAWDMWLMKNCQHNIIANSTFSWWGAYLNENPDKIVIVPKNWFADGIPCEIVPTNWLKI